MVRFGIAGFGLHAVKRLMPGFARSKNCRVTALSRRDITEAKKSAAEYGIPLAFDSVADLCASPEVDAVLVTTPNSLHLADVLDAVDAGKPVLCEKPLAMNAEECRQMVKAARHKGVLFGVAHVFRFNESVRGLREWVAAGKVGRPVFARSEFSFLADPSHPRRWLYDAKLAGAGPIFDVGVHCIDALRFILQDEVVRVSASALSDERSGDVESAASLTLEFSRGTLGTVMVSYRAEYRTQIELIGETGVLRADDGLNVEHPIEMQLRRNGAVLETKTASNQLVYTLQVDAFADAVEGKLPFPIPGEEGWQNQEVLDAALRSVKSGKAEAVVRVVS
jgi:1,5-anhydro-D-fructose reductase (1,5-anhydro-D-mannitol-forming)